MIAKIQKCTLKSVMENCFFMLLFFVTVTIHNDNDYYDICYGSRL